MSSMIGRLYVDPGDRWSGRHTPPLPCVVVTRWGAGGGPRNVAVRYLDTGETAVIPFPRRLRRLNVEEYPSLYPWPGGQL